MAGTGFRDHVNILVESLVELQLSVDFPVDV